MGLTARHRQNLARWTMEHGHACAIRAHRDVKAHPIHSHRRTASSAISFTTMSSRRTWRVQHAQRDGRARRLGHYSAVVSTGVEQSHERSALTGELERQRLVPDDGGGFRLQTALDVFRHQALEAHRCFRAPAGTARGTRRPGALDVFEAHHPGLLVQAGPFGNFGDQASQSTSAVFHHVCTAV